MVSNYMAIHLRNMCVCVCTSKRRRAFVASSSSLVLFSPYAELY